VGLFLPALLPLGVGNYTFGSQNGIFPQNLTNQKQCFHLMPFAQEIKEPRLVYLS
jgi:hypothetical protein